ncbi:TonB family protein [candidate division KSB1 bacterium]|nr:TonB family protein [candidate division KSB1 bacterium]
MAKSVKQLLVKIEQSGKVSHRRLRKRDRLTIGQHPNNDVTIYGEHFPKRHDLFTRKNNHFQLNFNKHMRGEVHAGESRLSFRDMIAHHLLPLSGDSFTYPITEGNKGIIVAGDAKITFQFVDGTQEAAQTLPKFKGYSWIYATFKDLGRDLPFKIILILMIVLHVFILRYMNTLPTDITTQVNAIRVPERLAKIIVKNRPVGFIDEDSTVRRGREDAEQTDIASKAKKGSEAPPERQGILGLLTGVGGTGQSSPLADFLLDKGLVKELDEVMSTTALQIGRSNGKAGDDLNDLIAASEAGGGIEDILGNVDQVESVSFGEKGRISVDRIGSMTGTGTGLGKRSEDSVRRVMLNYTGRLTYIYNKYLKHQPDLGGKMVVEVVIAASGAVSSVKLISSSLNKPEFEREILNFVRRWKYEAIDEGTVTVTYPLVFNKIS